MQTNNHRKPLEEYIRILEAEMRKFAGAEIKKYKSLLLPKGHKDYKTVDLTNWTSEQKEMLFTDILEGAHYFYFVFSQGKSFPVGAINEVINSVNGKNEIQFYNRALGRFRPETLNILNDLTNLYIERPWKSSSSEKYNSDNWLRDAAGTNDPETMNDVYWNLD
jgi:hypothetical protein